ncbi:MAG: cold shock domain-containing protein [Candidatus Hatepunaea meridiana]|nr:cold shock domain-containing protein [Candidatus Hatepunaea meridiana]
MTENIRHHGKVVNFLSRRGYGFLQSDDGKEVFVHYSDIRGKQFRTLVNGEEVEFGIISGPKGLQATDVHRLNPPPEEELVEPIDSERKW